MLILNKNWRKYVKSVVMLKNNFDIKKVLGTYQIKILIQ